MQIKTCSTCRQELSVDQFSFKNKAKDLRSGICKQCHKQYVQGHYLAHKEDYIRRSKANSPRYHQERVRMLRDYKAERGCVHCGERNPVCLDFHHHNKDKEFSVAMNMWRSIAKVMEEVRKCIVVCSNCHRKIHAGELGP